MSRRTKDEERQAILETPIGTSVWVKHTDFNQQDYPKLTVGTHLLTSELVENYGYFRLASGEVHEGRSPYAIHRDEGKEIWLRINEMTLSEPTGINYQTGDRI